MMKKRLCYITVLLLFALSTTVSANMVTIKLDGIFASGVNVGALQMGFDTQYDFPFLSDDNDPFTPKDISWDHDFGDEGIWDNPIMSDNWYLEALEDYNPATGIALADGFSIYCGSDNEAFALHDGSIAELSSVDTTFRIDLSSIQVFNFVDTANPIPGINFTEVINGNNQIITISAVPIPPACWLFGFGLIGMLGIRRKFAR